MRSNIDRFERRLRTLKGKVTDMDEQPKPIEEMTFREASAELDGIVRMLESNTMELEDTLKAYERGVALIAALQKRLADAEQRVEVLMGELSGQQEDDVRDSTLS